MINSGKFYIVPWEVDFLEELKRLVSHLSDKDMSKTLIVFPNARPGYYLINRYKDEAKKENKEFILPEIITTAKLFAMLEREWFSVLPSASGETYIAPLAPEEQLDRIARIYTCVEKVFQNTLQDSKLKEVANNFANFFPWGQRMDSLFEECFLHRVELKNLLYAEAEVAPSAAILLGELGRIWLEYKKSLKEDNATTPAFEHYEVSQKLDEGYPLPEALKSRHIILAGFAGFSKVEEILLKYLWEHGAHVCIHSDANFVSNKDTHYACNQHKNWIRRWKIKPDLWIKDFGTDDFTGERKSFQENLGSRNSPEIRFFSAYDAHSQLVELKKDLLRNTEHVTEKDDSLAILLPSADLLMPTLHTLPHKDINVSLGYPVNRSLLGQLLENILQLQENFTDSYMWQDVLNLLQHPYTSMLSPEFLEEKPVDLKNTWQSIITQIMKEVRQGESLVDISDLLDTVLGDYDSVDFIPLSPEMDVFIGKFFDVTIKAWENISNLEQLATALTGLMEFLLVHGQTLWVRFPIDAESLARLVESIIPSLAHNKINTFEMSKNVLFNLLRGLFENERIAFEADPLEGLQVLGIAESHLLHFEHIHILNCVESQLPGSPRQDPLMPDSLRVLLGLPDNKNRESLAAYTFYRLLAGAKKAYLYWQEGVESSGIQDSKAVRSRFVEELLWKEEKLRGARLKAGESPFFVAECHPKAPPHQEKKIIECSESIKESLERFIQKRSLSASMLTMYMNCPARFYYHYLAHIRPVDDIVEGNNYADFGTFIHNLLKDFYTPHVGKKIKHDAENLEALLSLFKVRHASTRKMLAPESYLALKQTVPYFFERFWAAQDEEVIIHALEKKYSKKFQIDNRSINLEGTFDRVHISANTHWILDYKTGSSIKKAKTAWLRDADFMKSVPENSMEYMTRVNNDKDFSDNILREISHKVKDIQLPFYLYLYNKEDLQINAAWVHLAAKAPQDIISPLFDERKFSSEDYVPCLQNIEKVIQYILLHMLKTTQFSCFEGAHCEWCPHRKYC